MFYLASQSPRRKELLTLTGLSFEVLVSGCDETVPEGFTAEQTVQHLANLKAEAVLQLCKDEDTVLAADTVVVIDGNILGKPKDKDDAVSMLRSLSGRTHTVMTGVCIASGTKRQEFVSKTEVTFYDLTDEDIKHYVATGDPMDKAGGYGIQSKGVVLVEKINGDYSNVVGLPLAQCVRALRAFGIQ
ncbi:MAG: septum formation inhibitor Maf [Clostridia bacterium]|nr:septum formation inhibitor Maf [Clostridia bacterium]MBR2413426.1 septum formation inhibitor Maf [Clostridia bacterium]